MINREDAKKLLGGFAAGTLTPEEQQALFDAALDDQELFDELAREQAVRDLLRDPAAKAHLLAALDERPRRWWERFMGWKPAAAAAALAGVAVVGALMLRPKPAPERLELAQVRTAPPMAEPAPPPPPAPARTPEAAPPRTQKEPRKAPVTRGLALPARQFSSNSAVPTEPTLADKLENPPPPPVAVVAEAAPPVAPAIPAPRPESVELARSGQAFLGATPGGAVGGVVGGIVTSTGASMGARDLYYQTMAGFRAKEEDAADAAKSTEEKSKQTAEARRRLFNAAPGMLPRANPTALHAPANLGVKYTILRKRAEGAFVEANPDDLKTGDTVALRFEANDNGHLVLRARRDGVVQQIFSGELERQKPYTTAPLDPDDREILVTFSLQPQPPAAASIIRTQQATAERATYVVGERAATPVVFTIPLKYK